MYGECFVDLRQRTGYIMEGLMDVLNLERMGMKNCLAVFGTACSKIHVEKLSGWFNEVVIFPHNDEENMRGEKAGFKMAQQYHDALKLMGVSVLIAPVIENKKDPGEWTADDLKWVLDRLQEYREV
jgi:DNA primase